MRSAARLLLSAVMCWMLLLVCPEDARGADDIYDVTFDISGTCNTDADDDLVWNETQGRLGIGTATPGATLHVQGNLQVKGSATVFGIRGLLPTLSLGNLELMGDDLVVPDGGSIGIGPGSERLVFDSAGLLTVTAAHLRLDSTNQVQFNGTTELINQGAAGHLDLHADTSIDLNQNVDVTGNITVSGTVDGVDVSAIPTTYMPLAGGTFTGDVTLSGAPTADLHAATKKYVDDNLIVGGGVVSKVLIDTYEGNDDDSRPLDLGDNYHEIHIYSADNKGDLEHLVEAYAVGTTYGVTWEYTAGNWQRGYSNDASDVWFQGKMSGGGYDNYIKLGSDGDHPRGTNKDGWLYTIIAKKYSTVQTLP